MHQGIAFRTAYLVTGSAEDAEEAVTSGFLKAYRALGRFRRGKPFRPWLLAIVMNEARNRRRSSGRREHLALRAAEERRPGDAAPSPEAAILEDERRRALLDAVGRLPEEQRLAVSHPDHGRAPDPERYQGRALTPSGQRSANRADACRSARRD